MKLPPFVPHSTASTFAAPFLAVLLVFALAAPAVAQSATRTRLLSAPSPSAVGETVRMTAEVDGLGGGAPTGAASFWAGTSRLGGVRLRVAGAGQATIAAGGAHSCALTSAGGVKCWGSNLYGALGDGTTAWRIKPVDVVGLESGVTAIATGEDHACALTSAGSVFCWGKNDFGQLGDGTTSNRPTPVAVSRLDRNVAAIAVGSKHSCALTIYGRVLCWGYNGRGQLGFGKISEARLTPGGVSGLTSGVVAIAAGGDHSCALTRAGGVKCWGANQSGQLGDRTTTQRLTPVDVYGLSTGVTAITAGVAHTCAVRAGEAECWGDNSFGQLGDATTTNRLAPVSVTGLTRGVAAISAGGRVSCALMNSGAGFCWGDNSVGQLGDGTQTRRLRPVSVTNLDSGVGAIAVGLNHVCVLTGTGVAQCWGDNRSGQLGDSTGGFAQIVPGLESGVSAISVGGESSGGYTCALTSAGAAKCWGWNENGQLGDGTTINRRTPTGVTGLASEVAAIVSGTRHTCALTTAGAVKCWGSNSSGQLGDGTLDPRLTPVSVSGLTSGVAAIALGGEHTCALTSAGAVKCWGRNVEGQLGDGTQIRSLMPVAVSGLAGGVTAISAGSQHTCARTSAGIAKCWGSNFNGQLGDGTRTNRPTPIDVNALASPVLGITSGWQHTCAVTSAGAAKCWGYNGYGQLGDGTTTNRFTPVAVSGLISGVVSISSGTAHSCALTGAGFVQCWGNNSYGQLGDGTTTSRFTPVGVRSLDSGVAAITVGFAFRGHSCALTNGGAAKCWGWNNYGQIGDDPTFRVTPVVAKNFTGLSRSTAQLSTPALGFGLHMLKASYGGDALHSGSFGAARHRVR